MLAACSTTAPAGMRLQWSTDCCGPLKKHVYQITLKESIIVKLGQTKKITTMQYYSLLK